MNCSDDPIFEFRNAMSENGFAFNGEIIADGNIHRYYIDGDKKGSKNGWYSMYSDFPHCGSYGSWKNGATHKWQVNHGTKLSVADRKLIADRIGKAKKQRETELSKKHTAARKKAIEIYKTAEPVETHPYLVDKKVNCIPGIKIIKNNNLIIPLRDFSNKIHSLQTITPTGNKQFMPGGKVTGHFFTIPGGSKCESMPIYIAEGLATGATIRKSLSCSVVVAFNTGNLKPVAEAVRGKYPDRQIVIAADNDHKTENNPGLSKAKEAASAASASIVYPKTESLGDGSDFNDLFVLHGQEETMNQLLNGHEITPIKEFKTIKKFGFVQAGNLIAAIKHTDWLIKNILEAEGLSVLFGPPGSFKSFIGLDWCLSIATGTDWFGHKVKQGPVFIIIGEGHNGYAKRIAAWPKRTRVSLDDAPVFISTSPVMILDENSAKEAGAVIQELRKQHGKPALVVLDTLARNFGPGDENSTGDMTQFIMHLDQYIGSDFSRLLIHHTGHGDQKRGRGSSVLKGAADAEYRLSTQDNNIVLSCSKMKDATHFEDIHMLPEVVEVGGDFADPITSVVLRISKKPPVEEQKLSLQMRQAISLLELMSRKNCLNCTKDWMCLCIEEEVYTRSAFYNAANTLESRGIIEILDSYVKLS